MGFTTDALEDVGRKKLVLIPFSQVMWVSQRLAALAAMHKVLVLIPFSQVMWVSLVNGCKHADTTAKS